MNTITTTDDPQATDNNPGLHLSALRQQKGFTIEYVASKLHLRVRVIELIENGDFKLLPEPVFIKGYLRAYSKLLGVPPEPFLAVFNEQYVFEKKSDRALWQSRREPHKAEYFIRLFTIFFAIGVLIAVVVWWEKNRDNQATTSDTQNTSVDLSLNETSTELKLTDLSKMHSFLTPNPQMSLMEKEGG
jgi:cytoskeletal protein RodZ